MTADAVRGHLLLLCTHPIHGSHSSYINTQMATVNVQMCSHKILHYCKLNEVQPESSQTRT